MCRCIYETIKLRIGRLSPLVVIPCTHVLGMEPYLLFVRSIWLNTSRTVRRSADLIDVLSTVHFKYAFDSRKHCF
jgi:hypothetical protein